MFPKESRMNESLRDLVKKVASDSVGQGWSSRICISNKLTGDTDVNDAYVTF